MTDPIQAASMTRVAQEVAGLREQIVALTQGLVMMAESGERQNELLRQILDAMQPPAADDSPNAMEDLIADITRTLRDLRGATEVTGREVAKLADRMVGAILRGVRTAPDADV